ncbi:MAG: quinone-dependent dihydroorotate dehydrogenase [Pseudomonadota bacterium]
MYSFIQKVLLKCDPEWSHDATIKFLSVSQNTLLQGLYHHPMPSRPTQCLGLTFPNPIGLAAGLDKNGECIDAFAAMGFGFIEIGTVTPRPQPGNPKPRMFRLPEHAALINRMGFNGAGVDALVENVKASNYDGILGINIGKNKDTPEPNALDDYIACMQKVYDLASYITINISSPNTPGLRNLQYGDALLSLLKGLKAQQEKLSETHGKHVPLLVKIAPDITNDNVQEIADALRKTKMDGVIATNTTLSREAVEGHVHASEAGGLSGAVLNELSLNINQQLNTALKGELPIIGVGGISSQEDAKARFEAGATLLQVYTGFIYKGPKLIAELANA